jgi:dipeptidase E
LSDTARHAEWSNVSPLQRRRLLALGGGGFFDTESSALDDFALGLTGTTRPKVCLIPTACGDASAYITGFYRSFAGRADCSHLSLYHRDVSDLNAFVCKQDLLYIGGGNTANLLALWRLHGLDAAVREAWEAGIVIVGASAGACALFDAGVSASFGPIAPLLDGLGLVPGAFCPHYPQRRDVLIEMLNSGLPLGWGASDGCGLYFTGTLLAEALTLTAAEQAVRLEPGRAEALLPTRTL